MYSRFFAFLFFLSVDLTFFCLYEFILKCSSCIYSFLFSFIHVFLLLVDLFVDLLILHSCGFLHRSVFPIKPINKELFYTWKNYQ